MFMGKPEMSLQEKKRNEAYNTAIARSIRLKTNISDKAAANSSELEDDL